MTDVASSFQSIKWDTVQWDKLTPEEKWRLEHMKLHEKHRGHESMHAEMILILFTTLVVSQIAFVKWRQVYPKSYHVSENSNWTSGNAAYPAFLFRSAP